MIRELTLLHRDEDVHPRAVLDAPAWTGRGPIYVTQPGGGVRRAGAVLDEHEIRAPGGGVVLRLDERLEPPRLVYLVPV